MSEQQESKAERIEKMMGEVMDYGRTTGCDAQGKNRLAR